MSPTDSGNVNTSRLFVALSLPEHVKHRIETVQEELRAALSGGAIRWTKRAQLHLTLKFLGDVESQRIEGLTHALALACKGFGALSLGAEGIGVFPHLGRPRLVWVGVDDVRKRLPLLQRTVETAVGAFTTEGPEAMFTGHVTVGRCKVIKRAQIDLLSHLMKVMEHRQFGEWTADTVEVVRSELGPGGSRYTTLSAIPL